jgi:hypothetical protein
VKGSLELGEELGLPDAQGRLTPPEQDLPALPRLVSIGIRHRAADGSPERTGEPAG